MWFLFGFPSRGCGASMTDTKYDQRDVGPLISQMRSAIVQSLPPGFKVGVAFSGGVDSTLLSKLCVDLGYDVTLLTVGFSGSHDILFSKDINSTMDLQHHILEIGKDGNSLIQNKEKSSCISTPPFEILLKQVRGTIKTDNLSWNENCIAFYYIATLAKSLGIETVVTANGIDELFCGYNAYREAFSKGEDYIMSVMNKKIENEIEMMRSVNRVTQEFCVKIVQPLLSPAFITFAKSIPVSEKIKGQGDLIRKHIIRDAARLAGVPAVSFRKRKKAMQYGSLIHKTFTKLSH